MVQNFDYKSLSQVLKDVTYNCILDMLSHICVPNQDVRNLEEQWLKPFGMLGIVTCVV